MATRKQVDDFIAKIASLSIAECQRRKNTDTGWILPSVCIAQACLESGFGTSGLTTKANACFGIKAKSSWKGKVFVSETCEVYDGIPQTVTDSFRAYDSIAESVSDHYDFLTSESRYAKAVNNKDCLSTITAIKNGGYATDPDYIKKVFSIVQKYDLTKYDSVVLNQQQEVYGIYNNKIYKQFGVKINKSGFSTKSSPVSPVSYNDKVYEQFGVKIDLPNPNTESANHNDVYTSSKKDTIKPWLGYDSKTKFINITQDDAMYLYDQTIQVADERKISPLPSFDYIPYGHRIYANDYSLKLGDTLFLIPPEFISIVSESQSENIITLRQENTHRIKNGYQRRTIIMDLIFYGSNQINGYKVESPEGYYYVDGLRQLLAQFKCTPFLPIKNTIINDTYGIFSVALQSIVFQTVEGYPNMISANITLQEATIAQYIESHDILFDTCIDWDLFRFYYQRLLTEKEEYKKLKSIDLNNREFKLSILNDGIFKCLEDSSEYNFYNILMDKTIVIEEADSNYITYIDSNENDFRITSFQCAYSNMLTMIQMADYNSPTIQYMGGLDTIFNITFETTDIEVVRMLEDAQIKNNSMIKENKKFSGVGFVKLECELTQFCGTRFVLIDSVSTNTVPGFPGLINVQIQCVSYDVRKEQVESLDAFKPFGHKDGTKSDCITQDFNGLCTKINQDLYAEGTLRDSLELYPDLRLPKYNEVNEAIEKIKAFRATHTNINGENLSPLPYDKYPQSPQKLLHGSVNNSKITPVIGKMGIVKNTYEIATDLKYDGYVDPDFYVFYPYTVQSIEASQQELGEENTMSSFSAPKAPATQTTYSKKYYPKTDDKTTSNVSLGVTDGAIESKRFIDLLSTKLGCKYEWGCTGENDTFDCSGFVTWGLRSFGLLSKTERITSENLPLKTNIVDEISMSQIQPADILLYRNESNTKGHVAVYIGNGMIIHSGGSENGTSCVNIRKASYMSFQRAFRIKGLVGSYEPEVQANTIRLTSSLPELKKGDSGDSVKSLQQMLNVLIYQQVFDYENIKKDGEFGEDTEKCLKAFQEQVGLAVTGVWTEAENEKAEEIINTINSGVSYNTTNNSSSGTLTKAEIEAIARVIAGEAKGGTYIEQIAIAQVIYDRFTDTRARFGNLKDILDDRDQFCAPFNGNLTITTCLRAAKAVFCEGERSFVNQKVFYFLSKDQSVTSFKVRDKKSTRLGNRGEYTFWGDKETGYETKFTIIDENDSTDNYVLKETTITNASQKLSSKVCKQFGMPILVKTEMCLYDNILNTKCSDMMEAYNLPEDILMSSFVDMTNYSARGRLLKAFPTFLFALVDDDGYWYDGQKFWANYYILKSVMDIQVVSYNDMPMQTATITVSNAYHNLDTIPAGMKYYSILSDSAYADWQKKVYKYIGVLFSSPKITKKMLDLKNILYNQMKVTPGVRVHIRMGYGSDPMGLPVVLNGYISEVEAGDTITFACVSDGVELTNSVITTDKSSDNGGLLGLGLFASTDQESSDIISDILTKRESNFWNYLCTEWYEGSNYGIEHFGLYFQKTLLDKFAKASETAMTVAGVGGVGVGIGTAICPGLGSIIGGAIGGIVGYFTADGLSDINMVQYDLCKNIYRGNYEGDLFIYDNFFGFLDGEKNMVFNLYNKTPWDAIQMAVQNTPEYIGMPMYHQFDSRLFYGLPWWLAKYRYDKIGDDYFEEAKPYAQVHFIDSMCDIIDNKIIVSNKNLYTNSIVMYNLGGSIKASSTMYSDKSIYPSQQKTKIFDSSVKQDIIGPDQIYEWIGIDLAEEAASRVGVSQLIYNWEKQYQGDLIILGDSSIKPYDYLYLNDTFVNMNGMCTVRCVTHCFSSNTGFITTLTPSCISAGTFNNSEVNIYLANICTIGGYFSYYSSIKREIIKVADSMKSVYWRMLSFDTIQSMANTFLGIVQLGIIYNTTKKLISACATTSKAIKEAKIIASSTKIFKSVESVKDIWTATKTTFGSIKKLELSGISSGILTPWSIIAFAVTVILEKIIDWAIDYFKYNNCIKVFPLCYEDRPFMAVYTGEKILGYDNSPVEETISDKLEEK